MQGIETTLTDSLIVTQCHINILTVEFNSIAGYWIVEQINLKLQSIRQYTI